MLPQLALMGAGYMLCHVSRTREGKRILKGAVKFLLHQSGIVDKRIINAVSKVIEVAETKGEVDDATQKMSSDSR